MTTLANRVTALEDRAREINSIVSIHTKMVEDGQAMIKQEQEELLHIQKAKQIIQNLAKETQAHLEKHLSGIVTMALQAVFPSPPEFKIQMEIRRGQVECDILFVDNGNEYRPISGAGGGMLDIASFALRVSFWALTNLKQKIRHTLILDEPFKNVSPDLQDKVSVMVKELSHKLGVQIIMVSHAEDINTSADKTFHVSKPKEKSIVKVVN